MFKKCFIFIFLAIFSLGLGAQELKDDLTRLQSGEDVNVLYRNEASFGIFAHSAGGFGLAYRRGQHVTGMRKRMFEIEAQNFKHPKEIKSVNQNAPNAKGYIYGKLNSVLLIRSGVGYQNVIYQKSDKKSVEIRCSYFLGATLAFAKPVYLEVHHTDAYSGMPIITTERYVPGSYNDTIDNVLGKASFFKGMDKTKIYPAAYAKLALSFEYADRFNGIKAIETGAVVDIYPYAIPMMAHNKKQEVLVSLYIKFVWGKKWF